MVGIDYTAVQSIAEMLGIEIIPAVLGKINALEQWELARQKK